MVARKTRITLIIIAVILIVAAIAGILIFLYIKTDAFKTSDVLFGKYFSEGFNGLNVLKEDDNLGINDTIKNGKYQSTLTGKVEYTTNVGTDTENKNNSINQVNLIVNSNVDNQNDYEYKNIDIGSENEQYIGVEYIQDKDTYGTRLKGVKQFVSDSNKDELLSDIGLQDFNLIIDDSDIREVLSFNEQEKQSLVNTYSNVIKSNIPKDKFSKQKNTLITMENGDTHVNAYIINLSIEEYNNLYEAILQNLEKDEVILKKIDQVQDIINKKYPDYSKDNKKSLKDEFTDKIDEKIETIKNNNIGNDQVKIMVFESNGKTVRYSIDKSTEKWVLDIYENKKIKLTQTNLGLENEEKTWTAEKSSREAGNSLNLEYEDKKNDSVLENVKLDFLQNLDSEKINRTLTLTILKGKYQGVLTLSDDIKQVSDFENKVTLDEDNIKMSDLDDGQKSAVIDVLKQNLQGQFDSLYAFANREDYRKAMQNFGIIDQDTVQVSDTSGITDTERKRFNLQFEFFESKDLTSDNIKELINTSEKNLENVKVGMKDGSSVDFDASKLDSSSSDSGDYLKNISEIQFYIKANSSNEQKKDDILKYIEKNSSNKYTVTIDYDNDGLVKVIHAQIQKSN